MSYRESLRALGTTHARSSSSQVPGRARQRDPRLAGFPDGEAILAVLRDPLAAHEQKDGILAALVSEHQEAGPSGAFPLLVRAMFPVLDRIHRQRCHPGRRRGPKHPRTPGRRRWPRPSAAASRLSRW